MAGGLGAFMNNDDHNLLKFCQNNTVLSKSIGTTRPLLLFFVLRLGPSDSVSSKDKYEMIILGEFPDIYSLAIISFAYVQSRECKQMQ